MESDVWELNKAGVAVELLTPLGTSTVTDVGIRLRTYGKLLPRDRMVLCRGATFVEALNGAIAKAQAGRWEPLEWAARPWDVDKPPDAARFGL